MVSKCFAVRLLLLASFLATVAGAGAARASDEATLRQLNQATLDALAAGDAPAAVGHAETALAAARPMTGLPPELFAFTLNNLAYALSQAGGDGARAEPLWAEALEVLERAGAAPGAAWVTVMVNWAIHDAGRGRSAAASERLEAMLARASGTPVHGQALGAASSYHFTLQAFPAAVARLQELLSVAPDLLRGAYGDVYVAYSEAQTQAEAEGRTADAVALIDGKIAIVRQYLPPADADPAVKDLLFQKFFQFYQAEDYGPAKQALSAWAAQGPLSAEDKAYIEEMAPVALAFTQIAGYTAKRSTQLDYAELAVVFAGLLEDPADPRLGLALRELAWAQSNLGRTETAAQTLRRASEVLRQSAEGRKSLHLLFADLASNAWLRSDLAQAEAFYARADSAYESALAAGAPTLQDMDLAINAINRARLLNDLGRHKDALRQTETAWAHFEADAARGAQKWNAKAQAVHILSTAAVAESELGRREAAVARLRRAESIAREVMPETHPDLALTLSNTADLLFVLDRKADALALARDAVAINRAALPETIPQRIESEVQVALYHLAEGDGPAALDHFRRIAEARKSPVYRDKLPEAAENFEYLAWLLLKDPAARDAAAIDEALEALQWTQVTRSAEALSLLEARLALDDPGQGAVLQRRQDLLDAHAGISARLLAAYAADDPAGAGIEVLTTRLGDLDRELAEAESALAGLGLDLAGLGGVQPLPAAEIQALLSPDEALVTFLLPSLDPARIAGLEETSNLAIAITREGVEIAAIAEHSRGTLATRIDRFRCEMSVNDPACATAGAAGLRGAMTSLSESGPDDSDRFDFAAAHALYRDLFGGIEGALAGKGHVIIVPPADLLRLPFQALITTADGPRGFADADWLIRRHGLSVLPSVASLRSLRGRAGAGREARLTSYMGFGDPVIGSAPPIDCGAVEIAALRAAPASARHMAPTPDEDGFLLADTGALSAMPRLPDSACELQAIGELFDRQRSEVYLRAEASETTVKGLEAEGRLAEADVLVFATHGLTAGEAGAAAPGLVLTPPDTPSAEDDGLLTAAEIATFTLDAELVVLSACNTAAGESGDDDGLSGLARAFFQAGAASILVTHWAVYSSAAVEVSTRLVSGLAADPAQPHARALRAAVLDILADGRGARLRHHPRYWAAFAIVGANGTGDGG